MNPAQLRMLALLQREISRFMKIKRQTLGGAKLPPVAAEAGEF